MKTCSIWAVVAAVLACATPLWAQDRGRVYVQNGSVYGDDGTKIRGSSNNPDTKAPSGVPASIWEAARDKFHLNALRCLCYRGLYNGATPTSTWANIPIPQLLPLLDTWVNQASQYGFYIIINYTSEYVPDPNDFIPFWQAVAPRYANRTHVLYEVANEYASSSFSPSGYTASDIQWQQNAYHLIRSLAPSSHIITNSFASPQGSMLNIAQQQASGANAIDYSNASLGYHYPFGWHTPEDDTGSVLACKAQYPVICTEGADNVPGGTPDQGIAWHETNGIAWFTLAFALDGSNPVYDPPPTWPVTWPLDPNTSDGTGPGNQGAPPPPPPAALIGDADFENQTSAPGGPLVSPWSGTGPARVGVDDTSGVGGSKCGFIYSPAGTGWSAITQTGTLSANTDYTLSVQIQTSSPFPGGTIGIQTPDGSTVLAQQAFGEQDSYGQVTITFNSGSATTLTIFAGFANNTGQGAWIHADAWSLAQGGGSAQLIQDPNYDHQAGNGNPLVSPWSATGPARIGLDGFDGMNGSPCGFIYDGSGTGARSAITQTVAVNPNTNYTLSCSIQTDPSFPAQGLMGAQAADGTILASQSFGQMTNYTQLTVNFNSGSNTSVVVFAGFTDQGPGAWIHVDNWSMVDPPGTGSSTSAASGLPSGAGTGGRGACGLTGLETVLVLGFLALRRWRL